VFLGEYRNKLDNKGRIAVPAKFRGELGDSVVINRYYTDGCLAIYPEKTWQDKYSPIINTPDNKRSTRDMIRVLTKSAVITQFDGQGRVLIPANLLEKVQLVKNAVFIGAGDHIEIWSEEVWNAYDETLTDEEIERISESF